MRLVLPMTMGYCYWLTARREHKIAGRSKMRKRELVAALEAALGFEPLPPHPPAAF